MTGRPMVPDRRVALLLGVGLIVVGSWLLTDAYERRGRHRPAAMRLIPGA